MQRLENIDVNFFVTICDLIAAHASFDTFLQSFCRGCPVILTLVFLSATPDDLSIRRDSLH